MTVDAERTRIPTGQSHSGGVDGFVDRYADTYRYYGSGKVALRDGLRTIADRGETVLFPAYLPDAVVEPVRELDLEPRYYAVTRELEPDLADLEARLDEATAAVVSVNYFGYPQSRREDLARAVDGAEAYLVDDNAHGPFSVHEDRLLGTNGDLGITSLRKVLPIPNGAVLYLSNPTLADRFDPSAHCGVADRVSWGDVRFRLANGIESLASLCGPVGRTIGSYVDRPATDPAPPMRRYEASKEPLSKLAASRCSTVDPVEVRDRRRANVLAWQSGLTERADVIPVFAGLPSGICPQVYPVYVDRPRSFLQELAEAGVRGAATWPRLPDAVSTIDDFETTQWLARHVITLPVHQGLDPVTIEDFVDRLVDSTATDRTGGHRTPSVREAVTKSTR